MNNSGSRHKNKVSSIRNLIIIITIIPAFSFGQTRGSVEVIKDPLIDTLIAKRPLLNKTRAVGEETLNGYRVQIFFGSNRQAAFNAQAKFMDEYPEFRTYISYTEPNFKVQAGDFRTRLEAVKLQKGLTSLFPILFIIPMKINPPKPDTVND